MGLRSYGLDPANNYAWNIVGSMEYLVEIIKKNPQYSKKKICPLTFSLTAHYVHYFRSEPKTVVGDANAVKIGNNFIFESPYISTITVTFDLLDDISNLPDLQNPNSPTFQTYSQAFCQEVKLHYFYKCVTKS